MLNRSLLNQSCTVLVLQVLGQADYSNRKAAQSCDHQQPTQVSSSANADTPTRQAISAATTCQLPKRSHLNCSTDQALLS